MKEPELIENKTHIDFKHGETEIKFDNCIESWAFWDDIEKQANRAKFRLKKLNPKQSFNFDLRSMMTTEEERRTAFIKHLMGKYPEMDIEQLFNIIEKETSSITLSGPNGSVGPDINHPNPFFKFEVTSDLIKSVIVSCINKYEEHLKTAQPNGK